MHVMFQMESYKVGIQSGRTPGDEDEFTIWIVERITVDIFTTWARSSLPKMHLWVGQ